MRLQSKSWPDIPALQCSALRFILHCSLFELGFNPATDAESQSTGTGKCHEFPHNPPPITRASIVTTEGPVAQRLEQGTHNPLAGGSNPSGPTNKISRGRTRRPNLLF